MPYPVRDHSNSTSNRLILDELNYDRKALSVEHEALLSRMTDEQKNVYSKIMDVVDSANGGVFFVYGYGGTGKTYLWRTLSAGLRSKGKIVLCVASSGIASLLLPGGRTAHSRFRIPLSIHENSSCDIDQASPLAALIIRCSLIIWNEAPMMHKHCFEAVQTSLQAIMGAVDPSNSNKPFGGKPVVFGGEFRQILPVIPKGSRQDIVNATINSSDIWRNCTVLRLNKNMRLQSISDVDERDELTTFAEWIASIGDGTVGGSNDGCAAIDIPEDIRLETSDDPISTIVESIYPMFKNATDDPSYLKDRAILAPTLEVVESINQYMSDMNSAEGRTYLSSDSVGVLTGKRKIRELGIDFRAYCPKTCELDHTRELGEIGFGGADDSCWQHWRTCKSLQPYEAMVLKATSMVSSQLLKISQRLQKRLCSSPNGKRNGS
ncbi:PIF1 helicase [Striga hermonthica]|uniref:ATP-dependent DNA helicase n=1 Tax=Striga hermonthica TaxID=68872 RepID=A0A9N7MKG0_STRHE|nr:PIF1 helicase [Striga hermonthica]